MVEGGSGLRTSPGRRGVLGWPGVADAPDWTLRVMIFSGEALDSLNMCYHPDEGQVLTITCAPYFPTC